MELPIVAAWPPGMKASRLSAAGLGIGKRPRNNLIQYRTVASVPLAIAE
ncbi:hypothetical protein [Mesorhizobium montanum]|nr:hypothetical protein [Mesorhizobium sp. MSK_1335]